jgi:hypothetical protein
LRLVLIADRSGLLLELLAKANAAFTCSIVVIQKVGGHYFILILSKRNNRETINIGWVVMCKQHYILAKTVSTSI